MKAFVFIVSAIFLLQAGSQWASWSQSGDQEIVGGMLAVLWFLLGIWGLLLLLDVFEYP